MKNSLVSQNQNPLQMVEKEEKIPLDNEVLDNEIYLFQIFA